MGVIYRHPSMDLTDFDCNYLSKLSKNISKEQKSNFLLGDFNINLFNYSEHIYHHIASLKDNIFSNVIDPDIISGNSTAIISDHLPQFAIIPNMFGNISGNKSNIYKRDWSKFDQENFLLVNFSLTGRIC